MPKCSVCHLPFELAEGVHADWANVECLVSGVRKTIPLCAECTEKHTKFDEQLQEVVFLNPN